jgi:hypothetical protein
MNTPLENEIAKRFGVLPNFFGLASNDPKIRKPMGICSVRILRQPAAVLV